MPIKAGVYITEGTDDVNRNTAHVLCVHAVVEQMLSDKKLGRN